MSSPLDPTNNAAPATGVSGINTSASLQFQFAKLQLALAEAAKDGAMQYMNEIQKSQDEQKKVANLLQEARDAYAATNGTSNQKAMSDAMKEYYKDNKLTAAGGENGKYSPEQWQMIITTLQSQLDLIGTDTQQKMIFVQDYMGQYNSYLTGSNSVIQQANQTLAELARTR